MDAHAALKVHLPGDTATDLDRVEFTPEGLGQGAVYQALEAPFEFLESHAGVSLPVGTSELGVGRPLAGPRAPGPAEAPKPVTHAACCLNEAIGPSGSL